MSESEKYPQALPAGIIDDCYEILRVLGQGEYSITYLATELKSEKPVVIRENLAYLTRDPATKELSVSGENEDYEWALNAFVKEAQALSKLKYPNIMPIKRVFKLNKTAYYVMPYVAGHCLEELRSDYGRAAGLTEYQMHNSLTRLLKALAYIHAKGVLHLNITPSSIFISDTWKPILTEFGALRNSLGKKMLQSLPKNDYMPIEQVTPDAPLGEWTDLYSLAGVFRTAISGKSPQNSLERSQNDTLVPLASEFEGIYDADFLAGIDKAFSLKPEDRFQSSAEWLEYMASITSPVQGAAEIPEGNLPVSLDDLVLPLEGILKPMPEAAQPLAPETVLTEIPAELKATKSSSSNWFVVAVLAGLAFGGIALSTVYIDKYQRLYEAETAAREADAKLALVQSQTQAQAAAQVQAEAAKVLAKREAEHQLSLAELDSKKLQLKELNSKLQSSHSHLKAAKVELAEYLHLLSEAKVETAQLKKDLAKEKADLAKAKSEAASSLKELEAARAEATKTARSLELSQKETARAKLETQEALSVSEAHKREGDELKKQAADLKVELTRYKTQAMRLQGQLGASQTQVSEAKSQALELQTELESVKAQLEALKLQWQSLDHASPTD